MGKYSGSPFLESVASTTSQETLDGTSAAVLDEAIAWAVRLESGAVSDTERAECVTWRNADPAHERAWQQVQRVEQEFRQIPAGVNHLAHDTLQSAERQQVNQRRRALKLLLLGAVGVAMGGYTFKRQPWQQRLSYTTAVGEQRRIKLGDGTDLQLNTDTDLEVIFSPLRRLIVLKRGEAFFDTGDDVQSLFGRRAFWVETDQIQMEAIGTRFSVRRLVGETRLHVAEGTVAMHSRRSPLRLAKAGETFVIHRDDPAPLRLDNPAYEPDAWTEGALVARQMRLADFISELARYSETPLHCQRRAADLRVSGVFQMNGPNPVGRALKVLARTLSVAITQGADGTISITRDPAR